MIARVTLEIALRKEFDYAIPPELAARVDIGTRVKVPFGPRQVNGLVTELIEQSTHTNLRSIVKVISAPSLVTPKVLKLARWIGDYYCCAPETALKSVLPEAVRKEDAGFRERLYIRVSPPQGEPPKLTKRQQDILNIVEEWRELPMQRLLTLSGATPATIRKLEDKGLITIASEVSERDPYALDVILPTQPLLMNPEQINALEKIKVAMAQRAAGLQPAGDAQTSTLTQKLTSASVGTQPCELQTGSTLKNTFLLHGVTGSGKTEVYLQAIAYALERGQGAIVLVPEISLTPQTVERFKARFSSGPLRTLVAVLHSHLSAGERHDEWHKIRQGRARIVIGARSAIFAPIDPLGLIIVDEEHEHSYKQEESPRYHARDVAVVRGQMEGAVVVLGSATPSMESFHNARRGKYELLDMPTRVDDQKMPVVRVVDMRAENRKQKGIPIFSTPLKEAITKRLEKKEQTILFLNRRGYSTSLQCPDCGYIAECPNCSVSLTFHRREAKLLCHICGYSAKAPTVCPEKKCGNAAIRYSGLGTEKVEDTLAKLFPHARITRMDSDTLKKKDDFRRILNDFRAGKIDILVGTQMIAKGLHFPNVTLVGIIYADLSLHIPDFRAGERTFQLITQVAGRAGRGDVEGEVFVQAFTPFHPAIQFARRHDFVGFYDQEIEFREQLKYPPVARIALLTLKGRNEEKVRLSAEHLKGELEKLVQQRADGLEPAGGAPPATATLDFSPIPGPTTPCQLQTGSTLKNALADLVIAGPAPAPLARAETFYRYHIMLRTRGMTKLSRAIAQLQTTLALPEDVMLAVDIDPVDLA